ncbi:hypothetical protein SNE510_27330 [Streptomyces sp. NE5-10]|uniref:DUF2690 domain-containing protein n=1 Tax=Streptomyces sp. NE5-10 TaxID=2759674 RepID=UPI001908EF34|nr:DUF2690 domain-containing protein [Streptomyces sp. NE5-10]GHJ93214.1 hypothetical protein SNE510_27330 [Streptomyces sp. NE5-10]
MSAWKALSGELDPDVRTFTERLRLVIDRSGLGVVAVAERTHHERGDWEAYLNGHRPVPRSAVVALSDITGADLGPLTAHWEHADRAWKRLLRDRAVPDGAPAPATVPRQAGKAVRGEARAPEAAGGAGGRPEAARDAGRAPEAVRDEARPPEAARGAGGWPEVVRGPGRAPEGAPAERTMRIRPVSPAPVPPAGPAPAPAPRGPAPGPAPRRGARRASPLLYAAGVVGAALVVTAAVLLVDLGGPDARPGARPAPPPATTAPAATPSLPEGVGCTGADCGGLDPEDMGCGGPLATTVDRMRLGGALVEVRHSEVCAAAWARISGGAPGDEVSVQAGTAIQVANVLEGGDSGAYTAMIPVPSGSAARACAALSGGEDGCTGG